VKFVFPLRLFPFLFTPFLIFPQEFTAHNIVHDNLYFNRLKRPSGERRLSWHWNQHLCVRGRSERYEVVPWESFWTVTVTGWRNVVSKERTSGLIWQMSHILTYILPDEKSKSGECYPLKMSVDSAKNTRYKLAARDFRITTFAASDGRLTVLSVISDGKNFSSRWSSLLYISLF
jgi:hypothetical protein